VFFVIAPILKRSFWFVTDATGVQVAFHFSASPSLPTRRGSFVFIDQRLVHSTALSFDKKNGHPSIGPFSVWSTSSAVFCDYSSSSYHCRPDRT
jgi:hypothetical protein